MQGDHRDLIPRIWRHGAALLLMSMSAATAVARDGPPPPDLAAVDASLVAAVAAASAPDPESPPPSPRPTVTAIKPPTLAELRARLQPWRNGPNSSDRDSPALRSGLDIRVIELPREGAPLGPPPKRAHHALSIGMDGPKQMLRGLGLDATECAGRFRMPSKLNRKGDGSTSVDISAQLGMACKF